MQENNKKIKTVFELLGYNFIIKNYQRGYRWGKKEVTDLLDDLNDFIKKHSKDDVTYCLQPLIVKKLEENQYEVIDGQQRLTTLHILLDLVYRSAKERNFNIEYESRDGSEAFLNTLCIDRNISENDKKVIEENKNNIDFYFMTEAKKIIEKWFKNKECEENSDRMPSFEMLLTR